MIRYFIDPLPGGRGQLMADLCNGDGTIIVTYPVGSPARRESILRAFPKAG